MFRRHRKHEHRDRILKISRAPAAIPDALAEEARAIAGKIANRARLCRRARGRNVRAAKRRLGTEGAGQRDRAAVVVSTRPLDTRRRLHHNSSSIRAIARLAARQACSARRGHHDQPDWGRGQRISGQWLTVPGATVHLYEKVAPAAEDGPCHPGRPGEEVARSGRGRSYAGRVPATMPPGSSLSQR